MHIVNLVRKISLLAKNWDWTTTSTSNVCSPLSYSQLVVGALFCDPNAYKTLSSITLPLMRLRLQWYFSDILHYNHRKSVCNQKEISFFFFSCVVVGHVTSFRSLTFHTCSILGGGDPFLFSCIEYNISEKRSSYEEKMKQPLYAHVNHNDLSSTNNQWLSQNEHLHRLLD